MRIELVFIFGMLKLLSLAVSQDIVPKNTNPYSFKGVMDSTTESVYSCWEWVSESTGLASPTCPYRPDFLQTVKTHVKKALILIPSFKLYYILCFENICDVYYKIDVSTKV